MVWEWQQAASNVLVAVGQRFINKVMEEVLTKFQPGILPHYFVMQTFSNLAVSNGEPTLLNPVCAVSVGIGWALGQRSGGIGLALVWCWVNVGSALDRH